jgi:hypothetical protein
MVPASLVVLSEVSGAPKIKLELPTLRLGDRLNLRFKLKRSNQGRSEVLEVAGDFRVTSVSFDGMRQVLEVETAAGKVPSWRAVKRTPDARRVIPPARSVRTVVK